MNKNKEIFLLEYLYELSICSRTPEETTKIGNVIGQTANAGDLILLRGQLGTGKTCLTQGILWGLGGTEYARSPTFVLMAQYEARMTLYHIDLYRIGSIEELENLGLEEVIFGEGLTVVEWAERSGDLFIENGLNIEISYDGTDSRIMNVHTNNERYSNTIQSIKNSVEFVDSE